jgi:hypothetical protein
MAFVSTFTILHTDDPAALARFYTQALSAAIRYQWPAEGEADYLTVGVGADRIGIGRYSDVDQFIGGGMGYVADPDGNLIMVVQPL